MYRMTILYPQADEATFDFDYYCTSHMKMLAAHIGDDVTKAEVTRGMKALGQEAPFVAMGIIWLKSLDGMKAALKEHGSEIMGDLKNYTNIRPTMQVEELVEMPALV